MFERSKKGSRAVLLCPHLPDGDLEGADLDRLNEFRELSTTAGAEILATLRSSRQDVEPKYYVGSGKAEQLAKIVESNEADLVLVDAALSPIQERNLEKLLQVRVLDRRTLILDIFSQRARSYEGQLQVELAQLQHLSTRLIRGWTHLERQKGGIGMRGPGETQLETDRRLLSIRVKSLKQRLAKVLKQREQGRRQRKKSGVKMVALVGYTNAGKSTLFNRLTDAEVYAQDQLFATLDPTVRQLTAITGSKVVLSDTVGFVRDLPHELVAAFRATLQEAVDADLLLHVIDDANPEHREHVREVEKVLQDLQLKAVPIIEVYNKIDQSGSRPEWQSATEKGVDKVWLSAQSGVGVDLLLKAIEEQLNRTHLSLSFDLPMSQARLRAVFYQQEAVQKEELADDGEFWKMTVSLPIEKWQKLAKSNDSIGLFVNELLIKNKDNNGDENALE